MAKALYIMQPIGADGALEAVDTLWFCSSECRSIVAQNTEHTVVEGENIEYAPGTVCDECGDAVGTRTLEAQKAIKAARERIDALLANEDVMIDSQAGLELEEISNLLWTVAE